MNGPKQSQVTLEQLLRLKRAEKPDEAFWGRFDQELRAKQLSAIVDRGSAWRSFGRGLASVMRVAVPVAGTAAAAGVVFWMSVRPGHNPDAASPMQAPSSAVSVVQSPVPAPVSVSHAVQVASAPAAMPVRSISRALRPAAAEFAAEESAPVLTAPTAYVPTETTSLSLAALPNQAAVGRELVGLSLDYPSRIKMMRSGVSEPLTAIVSPLEERRTRLVSAAVATADAVPAQGRDRIAARMASDRFEERMSRYELGDGKVSFKF